MSELSTKASLFSSLLSNDVEALSTGQLLVVHVMSVMLPLPLYPVSLRYPVQLIDGESAALSIHSACVSVRFCKRHDVASGDLLFMCSVTKQKYQMRSR